MNRSDAVKEAKAMGFSDKDEEIIRFIMDSYTSKQQDDAKCINTINAYAKNALKSIISKENIQANEAADIEKALANSIMMDMSEQMEKKLILEFSSEVKSSEVKSSPAADKSAKKLSPSEERQLKRFAVRNKALVNLVDILERTSKIHNFYYDRTNRVISYNDATEAQTGAALYNAEKEEIFYNKCFFIAVWHAVPHHFKQLGLQSPYQLYRDCVGALRMNNEFADETTLMLFVQKYKISINLSVIENGEKRQYENDALFFNKYAPIAFLILDVEARHYVNGLDKELTL